MQTPSFEDVHGFIIVSDPSSWLLALVNERNEESKTVKVTLLEKIKIVRGKRNLFALPALEISQEIQVDCILTVANVSAVDHSTFKLPQKYVKYANDAQEVR